MAFQQQQYQSGLSQQEYERQLAAAQLAAQYGDYSGYQKMGYDTNDWMTLQQLAMLGKSSGGSGSGSGYAYGDGLGGSAATQLPTVKTASEVKTLADSTDDATFNTVVKNSLQAGTLHPAEYEKYLVREVSQTSPTLSPVINSTTPGKARLVSAGR